MTSRPVLDPAVPASTRLPGTDARLMAVLVLAAGIVMILWAQLGDELIPVEDGQGFDGLAYADITRDPGQILDDRLDAHRIQRVVPSLIAYVALRPLGLHTSTSAIIVCFQLLNLVFMIVCCYLWFSTARKLRLSRVAAWIGFTALFVNYALLKLVYFYPVLTDTAGLLLGLTLLWSYLYRRYAVVFCVSVVAAFTWPTVFYSGLLLFALSRPARVSVSHRRRGQLFAFLIALAVATSATLVYKCGTDCVYPVMLNATMKPLLPLSLVALSVWVFLATRPLAEQLEPRQLLACVHWPRLVVAAIVFVAINYVQARLVAPGGPTLSRTLANTSLGGATKPLILVVAHTIFYGPAVMLIVLRWRRIVAAMSWQGPAFVLLMLVYVVLGISAESRILMNMWPFFAAFAAVAAHQLRWHRSQAWAFAGLSLLASRVWFPLYHGEFVQRHGRYPNQYYGMSVGTRMTVTSYLIMAGVTVICAVAVWWLVRSSPQREPAAAGTSAPVRRSSG